MKFRRSLYFGKDLPAEHVIHRNDIKKVRPGYGAPPKMLDKVIGSVLHEAVRAHSPVQRRLLHREPAGVDNSGTQESGS